MLPHHILPPRGLGIFSRAQSAVRVLELQSGRGGGIRCCGWLSTDRRLHADIKPLLVLLQAGHNNAISLCIEYG